MIINKVEFLRKDKNMQLTNNQNQTKILNLWSWNLNLEEKLKLIHESSINNQQFVCRELGIGKKSSMVPVFIRH